MYIRFIASILIVMLATGGVACKKKTSGSPYTHKMSGLRTWHGEMVTPGHSIYYPHRTPMADTFAISIIDAAHIYVNDSIIGGNYYQTKLFDTLDMMEPSLVDLPNTLYFNGGFDTHQGSSWAGVTVIYDYVGDSITLHGSWPDGNTGHITVTLKTP